MLRVVSDLFVSPTATSLRPLTVLATALSATHAINTNPKFTLFSHPPGVAGVRLSVFTQYLLLLLVGRSVKALNF